MDILYHTDDVLELRPRLWRIFLFMGVAFTLAGIVVFFFFGRTTFLECSREHGPNPNCVLTQSLIGFTLQERAIDDLHYARVIESRDSDDDLTYRIILETELDKIPLTSFSSSGNQKKLNIAGEINSFIEDSTKETLSIQQGGKSALLIPLIFTIIGILEILVGVMGRHNIWYLNKVERVATHNRPGLTGTKITQYALDDIIDAIVTGSRDSDGDTTYRVEFVTKSGERIPMSSWRSSGYKRKAETAALIREFLRVNT